MERNIPLHIERLIYDLNHSTRTEAVLLATANLISQDVTLMQVYLQLGYSLQSNQFLSSPTAQQALCLISQEYGVPLRQPNIDSFLANTPPRQTDPDTGVRHEMMKTFYEQGIDEIVAGVEIGLEVASEPSLSSVWDCFNVLPKAVQFSTPKPRKTHQSPSTQAT